MLSKRAERFIIELRMYLLSKGKNEKEIDGVIVELEDHLLQAEKEGKDIKDITGDSPREYMKSIGQEMGFDVRQNLLLLPMSALLIIAMLSFTSALRGDFTLSKEGIWGMGIVTVISIFLYGFLFVRVLPRLFHSKWLYVIGGIAYLIVFGFVFIVELMEKEPFYIATPVQNNLIVAGCIAVFMIWAFYSKTWITIIIPFFLSWGPLAERIIPAHINEDPFYMTLAAIIFTLGLVGFILFMYRREKKKKATNEGRGSL